MVVLWASAESVHSVCQLHRIRTTRTSPMFWLHQWSKAVSKYTSCWWWFGLSIYYICPFRPLIRCPARDCHEAVKCEGHFIDSFKIAHLEDCIKACSDDSDCQWYTLEKTNDHCLLYEECKKKMESCDTCATGPRECSVGYHGELKRLMWILALFSILFFLGPTPAPGRQPDIAKRDLGDQVENWSNYVVYSELARTLGCCLKKGLSTLFLFPSTLFSFCRQVRVERQVGRRSRAASAWGTSHARPQGTSAAPENAKKLYGAKVSKIPLGLHRIRTWTKALCALGILGKCAGDWKESKIFCIGE